MNNRRLLAVLLCAALPGASLCSYGQRRMLALEELFEIAESNSAQLRPSFTAEEEARRDISVARSNRLPEINAELSLSYIGDGFTTKRDLSDYQRAPIPHFGSGLGLNVTQPVYAGGAITGGIRLAEQKYTASRYATELKRDNIRFRLTGFYLDIYKYKNLRKVVESNLAQARLMLSEMQARYEQGVALRNDITRYELLVENLKLQIIKIDNLLEVLNNNLVVISGLPEGTVIEPDTTILERSLPRDSEQRWQLEAGENAPSLKLAQTGLDISRTAETLVKSERLPKIGLQASWTMNGPILVEIPPINRNLSYWFVGVGVSYNLSSLFKNNKALGKSKTAVRRAAEELDATRENLSMEVRADYIRYLEAYEELKTQNKSVELAESNYGVVSSRYSADMALITDLLDAASSKLDAEQQLVNARINIIYYYYKLLFTSGKI